MSVDRKVDFDSIAAKMTEASGADIRAVTQEAGMFAIRGRRTTVNSEDFLSGIKKVLKKSESLAGQNVYT